MTIAEAYLTAFAFGAAISIAGYWTWVLVTGRLGALITPRRTARNHVAAEFLTATLLLGAGIAMLLAADETWSRILMGIALGTLVYALFASPGLYEDRRVHIALAIGWVFTIPAIVGLFASI